MAEYLGAFRRGFKLFRRERKSAPCEGVAETPFIGAGSEFCQSFSQRSVIQREGRIDAQRAAALGVVERLVRRELLLQHGERGLGRVPAGFAAHHDPAPQLVRRRLAVEDCEPGGTSRVRGSAGTWRPRSR